jgi:hypothetical protein
MRKQARSWRRWWAVACAVGLTATAALTAAPAAEAANPGTSFTTTPAMAYTGTSVVMAAINGYTDSLDYWWEPAGSGDWHEETVATGFTGTPTIAWTGTSVVLSAIGENGAVLLVAGGGQQDLEPAARVRHRLH